MENSKKFYINGAWMNPASSETLDVINPATEKPFATIALGTAEDVDRAVAAAKAAFDSYSITTRDERIELLENIIAEYKKRADDLAGVLSDEMGAPSGLAQAAQVPFGLGHFITTLEVLKNFEFEEKVGTTTVVREPVGVCGLITPWNWPLNQIAAKTAPALAAGCTMVLKPSEIAPLNALILTEVFHAAGCQQASSTSSTARVRRSVQRYRRTPTSIWSPSQGLPARGSTWLATRLPR